MINEIIVRYLTENKRLVIPGFGAFIRKDEEGETVFVEFLKKDDQVLTALLAKAYGLSTPEALSAVAEYAGQVKRQTAAGEPYLIPGLGRLRADANGVLDLEYAPNASARKIIADPGLAARPERKSVPNRIAPAGTGEASAPDFRNDLRPVRPANDSGKKKRADLIMIIAILAAIVAIISMVYGIFVNSAPTINLKPTIPAAQTDTTAVRK